MNSKLFWFWESCYLILKFPVCLLSLPLKEKYRLFPLQSSEFPMIHFELNNGWQFYYKYVALVIVTPKKVIEKICKVIKLNFSSVEKEEINVSFKNNSLGDVCIKDKKIQIWFIIHFGYSTFWSGGKKLSEIIPLYISGDKSLPTDLFLKASLSMA